MVSAAAAAATVADAGDHDWTASDDDGADDEATLEAEELAAAADGIDAKVRAGRLQSGYDCTRLG